MAAKDVRFGDEVRQKMVVGVNTLANADGSRCKHTCKCS